MYLNRIVPVSVKRLARERTFTDEYRFHQEVWRIHADNPDRQRDFLYWIEDDPRRPMIYTLSARAPAADDLWQVETKPFRPALRVGDRLAFRLRANPTVAKKDAPGQRSKRHDVIMDAKRKLREAGGRNGHGLEPLVHENATRWLTRKAEGSGFRVEPGNVRIDRYRQHRLRKRRDQRPIRISSVDYAGLLTVEAPDRLLASLRQGIGPAKGFGMGLMLIRRS